MDTDEYDVLLIVAGLAHCNRFGFAMKPTAWSKFLGGGGDANITISHGCGGGDCGGIGNSDGDGGGGNAAAAMAEAEKGTAAFCRGDDSDEQRRRQQ